MLVALTLRQSGATVLTGWGQGQAVGGTYHAHTMFVGTQPLGRGDPLALRGLLYTGLVNRGALVPLPPCPRRQAAAREESVLTAGRFGPWRSGLLRRQSRSVLFTFKGII